MLPIKKMIITQTFTKARWQIVVKTSEATKPTKTKMTTKNKLTSKQNNNNNKTTTRRREEGVGVKKANN